MAKTNTKQPISSWLESRKEHEFRVFYNHTIFPELKRLNYTRIKLIISMAGTLLLLLGFLATFFLSSNIPVLIIMILPMLLFIRSTTLYYQNYTKAFKSRIINLIIDFLDDYVNCENLKFDETGDKPVSITSNKNNKPKELLPASQYLKKHLIQSGLFYSSKNDLYETEDFISGNVGSIPFVLGEVRIQRPSRITTNLLTVFQGVFLHAELETTALKGKLLIIPREQHEFFWRSIQQGVQSGMSEASKWIQNKDFRDHYLTYASKDVAIRRTLPEDMQRTIMNYYRYSGKELYLSFQKNHAYIALPRHEDLLEPPYFQSVVHFKLIHEFYEDITSLLTLVEALDKFH